MGDCQSKPEPSSPCLDEGGSWDLSAIPTEVLQQELARRQQQQQEAAMAQSKAQGTEESTATDHMSEKLFPKVKDLVKAIDTDHNGTMSKEEVMKWLSMMDFPDVEEHVNEIDKNNDGTIQDTDLVEILSSYFLASDVSGYGDCHLSADISGTAPVEDSPQPTGPYAGLTVVDLTRVLAGPYCTKMLAMHGARVIKVEIPVRGDDSRFIGPFVNKSSVYFQAVNGGKESIALNLKDEKEKAILERLLENADMLVENYRPGVLDSLGFGWERLHKRYPRLILVSISGYGQDGPCSKKPAYDAVVQGEGGIISMTGYESTGPSRVGISIGDTGAGLYAAIGAQAALFHRAKTGESTRVDVSMLDCQVALQNNEMTSYLATGKVPKKLGSRHPSIAPFQAFSAQDDYLMIAGGNDALFRKIAKVLGHPEWAEAEAFKTNKARAANLDALDAQMTQVLKTQPKEHWLSALAEAGVPSGPISALDVVSKHEQVQSRNMIITGHHPEMGPIRVAGLPIKYTAFPDIVKAAPAPVLDQHRDKVLAGL